MEPNQPLEFIDRGAKVDAAFALEPNSEVLFANRAL
jgi:hypothetical protein